MKIPIRTSAKEEQTDTVTLSAIRSSTYVNYGNNGGFSLSGTTASRYWTSNADGTYTFTYTYSPNLWESIRTISGISFSSDIADDVISYTYEISGASIVWTIIATNNPSSFSVSYYVAGYAYRVSAVSASYTFSELPSDITFTGIVRTSGTSYSSYSTSGNTVTLTWSSYYSGTEVSGTVSWTGYLTHESTKTCADVYFNGQLVDYVYFNGTRYPQ